MEQTAIGALMFILDRLSCRSDTQSIFRRARSMSNNRRFLALVVLGLSLASARIASGQSAQEKLAKAKTLRCAFQAMATASWTGGQPQAEIRPTKLTFGFDEINADEGTARMLGAFGPSDIIVRLSTGNLHFMQSFREGPLYTTTVFPKETHDGYLQAVHSRHEYTPVSLPGFTSRPEQYYGECVAGS